MGLPTSQTNLLSPTKLLMDIIFIVVHKSFTHSLSDVIDVTVIEPHSMENAEVRGRTRDYQ